MPSPTPTARAGGAAPPTVSAGWAGLLERVGTLPEDERDRAFRGAAAALLAMSPDHRFVVGIGRLRAFVEREGHAKVPQPYKDDDGFTLGQWLDDRRRAYKAGRMPEERVAAVEALGASLSPFAERFAEGLRWLRVFAEREGHANVPRTHTEGGFPLGSWLTSRRSEYGNGKLSAERASVLTALGVTLEGLKAEREGALFLGGIERLRGFVARDGHAWVPILHKEEDGFPLGIWLSNRRKEYHAGRLSAERVAALEALGVTWDNRIEALFADGIERLRAYVAREGHADVPIPYEDENGFLLGQWLYRRMGEYLEGKLSAERIAALEGLGVRFDARGRRSEPDAGKPSGHTGGRAGAPVGDGESGADAVSVDIGGSLVTFEEGRPVSAVLPDGETVAFDTGTAKYARGAVRWDGADGKCLLVIHHGGHTWLGPRPGLAPEAPEARATA